MPEVVLHGWDGTAGCLEARAVLTLKGLRHRFHPWTVRSITDVFALDRSGEGPVLRCDGRIVVGSRAIGTFLDDHHPTPPLRPRDISAAALCHMIEGWADASLGRHVEALCWLVPANRGAAAGRLAGAVAPAPGTFGRPLTAVLARARLRLRGVSLHQVPACEAALRADLDEIDRLLHDRDHLLGPPHGRTLADVAVAVRLGLLEGTTYAESLRTRPSLWRWLRVERDAWEPRTDGLDL